MRYKIVDREHEPENHNCEDNADNAENERLHYLPHLFRYIFQPLQIIIGEKPQLLFEIAARLAYTYHTYYHLRELLMHLQGFCYAVPRRYALFRFQQGP